MMEIRKATPQDPEALYRMILATADEQDAKAEVTTSPERLMADGFGAHPRFEAIMAFEEGKAVGFALYFPMYSAWKGNRTLYVEDLFVLPSMRHRGIAQKIFRHLEELALSSDSNLAWEVDRDNLWLRHLFNGMGAIDRSHKIGFYMEGPEMKAQTGL